MPFHKVYVLRYTIVMHVANYFVKAPMCCFILSRYGSGSAVSPFVSHQHINTWYHHVSMYTLCKDEIYDARHTAEKSIYPIAKMGYLHLYTPCHEQTPTLLLSIMRKYHSLP